MADRVYLDWNATTPLRAEARAAMGAAMDVVGNPSSVHAEGRAAHGLLERARAQVAAAVGCSPGEVVFTSGATEAASVLSRFPAGTVVSVQPTAHDALWAHRTPQSDDRGAGRGVKAREAAPSRDGATSGRPGCHVIAMGLANNETGLVTVPGEKQDGCWPCDFAPPGDLLLLDVTQAIGRMPFSYSWSGADLAVLSAHKFGGPKGVGALIVRRGLDVPPLMIGGGQEMGRRAGTENLIGIAGFGAAAQAAMADLENEAWNPVAKLRDMLEDAVETSAPGTIFVGRQGPRLANTSCMVTPGWKGETQVMQMDLAGFAVSAGSACSSGKVRPSRVLQAMGLDDTASASAIRVSLGPSTTEGDVMAFVAAWRAAEKKFRARAA